MTAVNNKLLKKATGPTNTLKNINFPRIIICIFIAISATRAEWSDIPLSILALILAASCQDLLQKVSIISAGIFMFAVMSLQNTAYIPYLLSEIIYISVYSVFGREKLSLSFSLVFFVFSKLLLTRSGQPVQYVFYTVLEAAAAFVTVSVIRNAREAYSRTAHSFTDTLSAMLSGLVIVLSLSGMDSHRLYIGSAVSLALSWLYICSGDMIYSFISLLCFLFSMSDRQGFPALFVCGLRVWLCGAICAEKTSAVIYPLTAFAAFAGNIIFISTFNGFSLLGTTLCGLLLYTLLPHVLKVVKHEKPETFSHEKDYRRLLVSMKKLEESLKFLGNCAIDISRLNEKNLQPQTLEDAVAEDICRKCEYNTLCWQEKYSFTSRQFSRYARSMHWAEERSFDMGFYSQCRQIEKIKASFEEKARLQLSKKYILQSQKNNQKLLQSAFMSIASTVGDMLFQNQTSRMVNSSFTMQMDRFLENLDIPHSYCLCSQNPDRANFAVIRPLDESEIYKATVRLEHLYGKKFSCSEPEVQGNEIIYTFYAKPVFSFEHSIEESAFRQINGDSHFVLTLQDRLYVLLSDGMGTGAGAAAESRTVIAMAKSLLSCGISMDSMLNVINLALNLRGNGENGASLEILSVDLFTGKAVLTKAGAGVSVVFNQDSLTRYYKDSLPLGILKDVKYSTDEFTLTENDTVVLMSDGVGNVSSNIRNLFSQSCEEVACFAINENKTLDDKTVIALRLKQS